MPTNDGLVADWKLNDNDFLFEPTISDVRKYSGWDVSIVIDSYLLQDYCCSAFKELLDVVN